MQNKNTVLETVVEQAPSASYLPSRRNFLAKLSGAAALTAALASCNKEADFNNGSSSLLSTNEQRKAAGQAISMGDEDILILNYAYLLEQLEAQFYIMVDNHSYSGLSDYIKMRFLEIRDHEIAHREFFKKALGDMAIPEIEFDFSMIDFSNPTSVLLYSKTFEDTGVAAYNGVGKYIKNPNYLLMAGKIVSVEARHASFLRSLDKPDSFANSEVVDMNGLDVAKSPQQIIKIVAPFIKTTMDFSKMPG